MTSSSDAEHPVKDTVEEDGDHLSPLRDSDVANFLDLSCDNMFDCGCNSLSVNCGFHNRDCNDDLIEDLKPHTSEHAKTH